MAKFVPVGFIRYNSAFKPNVLRVVRDSPFLALYDALARRASPACVTALTKRIIPVLRCVLKETLIQRRPVHS